MAMVCLAQAAAERCRGLKASRQKQVPHLRWSQAPPAWGRRIYIYILYCIKYIYIHITYIYIGDTDRLSGFISN